MPNLARTPVTNVNHPLITHETPHYTSDPNLGPEKERVTCSVLKKRLSLTPVVNTQNEESIGEKVKSPLRVETQNILDQSVEEEIEGNDVEDSEEEDRQSIQQFQQNVVRAKGLPYNKIMEQR